MSQRVWWSKSWKWIDPPMMIGASALCIPLGCMHFLLWFLLGFCSRGIHAWLFGNFVPMDRTDRLHTHACACLPLAQWRKVTASTAVQRQRRDVVVTFAYGSPSFLDAKGILASSRAEQYSQKKRNRKKIQAHINAQHVGRRYRPIRSRAILHREEGYNRIDWLDSLENTQLWNFLGKDIW